jgi:hypothetical protein
MVYCDYYYHDKTNNVVYEKVPELSIDFVINVRYAILDFGSGGAIWNKLIKRTIYEKVDFPKDGYAEAKYITTQTLFFAKKITYVDVALYHYQYNHHSWMYDSKRKRIRYVGLKNNFKKIFTFIENNYGKDKDIFEPELSIRIKQIKEMNPNTSRRIIKRILRIIVPVKSWREWLRNMYHKCIK